MDNRGRYGDSDRDRDYDRDRLGSNQRRNTNDRDERRDPSSTGSNSQPRRIDEEEEETSHYRSQIAPRNTNITTNRVVPASSSNNVVMERFYAYGLGPGIPMKPGGKSAAVVAIQENREREKRELSHLNDRFASYIERVRYLEAQNKKLQLELEHLRGKWGSQTEKVKEMYETEIREARRIVDDTAKDRASAELRAKRAEEETLKYKDKYEALLAGRDSDRQKIDLLQKQLADNEADLNLFRRRLADLEDEQKRYRAESQKLILDIQRVTQDLDHETIARVQLENEKQSLEEEINFLKQIHAQEIEELKQANLIGTALDPANFFKHELSNAIRDIREEYEQLNNHQRNELESWYRLKVTQAVQEIQSRRAIEGPENNREREEVKKLRTLVTDSRKDISAMRQRNGELENRIQELEELVQIERREGIQAANERDREIQELRARLEELGRDYDELVTTKSSLDAEIAIYRKLLEGEENRQGLKQIVNNVEEQARADFAAAGGVSGGSGGGGGGGGASGGDSGSGGFGTTSYSYSRSYRTTSGGQGPLENSLMSTSYQNYSANTRPESTMFDQIYHGYRRRPATISLNVQWIPLAESSGSYRWSGADNQNRRMKTVTFFGTGEMRGQQSKATTPPSSDYTDAYLSALASKSIPTRHVNRLSTSVYANTAPIPLRPTSMPSSTSTIIRPTETSQTRSIHIETQPVSKTVSSPAPSPSSSSTRSSSYSSSFASPSTTMTTASKSYEPFSTTQYSSPQSQTFTSSYSTLLRSPQSTTNTFPDSSITNQRTYTTISNRHQPSSSTRTTSASTFTSIRPADTTYDNIFKPLPPYSFQAYPRSNNYITTTTQSSNSSSLPNGSIYKPSVSFQAAPFSSIKTNTTMTTSATESIKTSTPTMERTIDRPETLLLQSSPMDSSPHDSSVQQQEIPEDPEKIEEEDEEPTRPISDPIHILENTLSKYDTLINQISEVLASVSPLSSSISTLSPGKSVLDYQLSSDDSPTIQEKPIQNESSEPASQESKKASHLIREDSYDKIVSAVSELESELTRSAEFTPTLATNVEEVEAAESTSVASVQHEEFHKIEEQALQHEEPEEVDEPSVEHGTPENIDEQPVEHPLQHAEPEKVDEHPVEEEKSEKTDEKVVKQALQHEEAEKVDEPSVEHGTLENIDEQPVEHSLQHAEPGKMDEHPVEEERSEKTDEKVVEQALQHEEAEILNEQHVEEETPSKIDEQHVEHPLQDAEPVEDKEAEKADEIFVEKEVPMVETSENVPVDETLNEDQIVIDLPENTIMSSEKTASGDLVLTLENETETTEITIRKKNEKRVRWSESVVDNEDDDEDESLQTMPSENIAESSESQSTAVSNKEGEEEETTVINQEESKTDDELVTSSDSLESSIVPLEQSEMDSTATATMVQDENVEQSIVTDHVDQSESDELTTESTVAEAKETIAETTGNQIVSALSIQSPIEILSDAISNRYISSDVYHGYLGEHVSFAQDDQRTEADHDETTKSLIASLRETITKPITPVIETIQNVVTSLQTNTEANVQDKHDVSLTSSAPVETKHELIDGSQNTASEEQIESKSVLETIRETLTAPISAVTEIVKELVSQTQSDQQDTSFDTTENDDTPKSTSDHQLIESVEQTTSTALDTISTDVSPSKQTEETEQPIIESAETLPSATTVEETKNIPSTSEIENAEIPVEEETHEVEIASALTSTNITEDIVNKVISDQDESFVATSQLAEAPVVKTSEVHEESILPETTKAEPMIPSKEIIRTLFDISTVANVTLSHGQIESLPSLSSTFLHVIKIEEPIHDQTTQEKNLVDEKLESEETSETKSTLEIIRDVITHPIATIQNVLLPSTEEQVTVETESTTEIIHEDEAKDEKTTFEAIRDVLIHPIDAISEKIESILSPSSHDEQTEEVTSDIVQSSPPSSEQTLTEVKVDADQTTLEKMREFVTHPITSITETVQQIISSPHKAENDEDHQVEHQTEEKEDVEIHENKSLFETIRETITSPIATLTEKVQHIVSNATESTSFHEDTDEVDNSILLTNEDHQIVQELMEKIIDSALSHILSLPNQSESISSMESDLSSPLTVLSNDDRTEISPSVFQQDKDLSFDQDTLTSEMTNVTWTDLVEGKSSEIIHATPAATITTNVVEIPAVSPSNDETIQRSSYESDSNSVITAVENPSMRSTNDYREVSPANTEEDSLELIHALQGHSIVLPTVDEKATGEHLDGASKPEKSSSSTASSSQVTSSDHYVSYAIHEMGSSSQERLPALPLAADLPVYELVATGSHDNQDAKVQSEASINPNPGATKDDDLTEFDATDNLTSFSDDVLIQKLQASAPGRARYLDAASSTDEDVDDFEEHDVSNLYRIVDEMTQHSSSLSGTDGQAFHRYDLLTASSNSNESMSKPQNDDLYVIPGFPGLWRPSADDNSTHSALANDADDESQGNDDRNTTSNRVKIRTNIRKTHITSTNLSLEPPELSNDVFDRPLNDFPFDISETESFKTCASTLNSSTHSKQQKIDEPIVTEPDEKESPEEKIYLIRERERGVSLPVTMKIDYDDMALRLSTSTPIEAPVYSQSHGDPPSPSTFSEPMIKGETSSRASTPSLSSNDSEQHPQKFPPSSWLNTVNTITTMIEGPDGPLESRTTILKSAKGPVSVAECDSQGRFVQIENTSRSKSISLAHWTLHQERDHGETIVYRFPENTLLKPNHSLKVFAQSSESDRRSGDLVASTLSTWYTDANVVTTLINAEGKDRASLTKKTLFS